MTDLPRIKEAIDKEVRIFDLDKDVLRSEPTVVDFTKVLFDEGRIANKIYRIKNVRFIKCLFNHQKISDINFYGCSFIDCTFNGAKIESCEFHKCDFVDSAFYKISFYKVYIDPKSFRFGWKWYRFFANVNVWLFQMLYRNSKDMHQEVFAMRADERFLFYRRYEYLFGKERSLIRFIFGLIYDFLLGSGYGIMNALVVTVLGITGFAWLIDGHLSQNEDFIDSLYFAVVSFTTVGYGDISPARTSTPLIITMFFLLISVIWCSVVTAIVVKRIVK